MVDPIDFHIDHPHLPEHIENRLLLVCILSLVIVIVYLIVKSVRNPRIGEGVNETMESRRKKWREDDIREGNEIFEDDDDSELSAE